MAVGILFLDVFLRTALVRACIIQDQGPKYFLKGRARGFGGSISKKARRQVNIKFQTKNHTHTQKKTRTKAYFLYGFHFYISNQPQSLRLTALFIYYLFEDADQKAFFCQQGIDAKKKRLERHFANEARPIKGEEGG
jgi:hypothetical protein